MTQRAGRCTAVAAAPASVRGGAARLSKADYGKQANGVCRDGEAGRGAADPRVADVTSMPEVARWSACNARLCVCLRTIRPPKQDRSEIAKWIALVDQTIDQAEVSAKSQRDGDIQRAVTANANGAALDRRADELAQAYGHGCASRPP